MFDTEDVDPAAARWSARAETRDVVIVTLIGSESVDCADRQSRRVITRGMNLSINFLPATVHSIVAGRGDHDDAGVNQPTDGATDRISAIRLDRGSAQTQVHHPDVVKRAIRYHPVKRAQTCGS